MRDGLRRPLYGLFSTRLLLFLVEFLLPIPAISRPPLQHPHFFSPEQMHFANLPFLNNFLTRSSDSSRFRRFVPPIYCRHDRVSYHREGPRLSPFPDSSPDLTVHDIALSRRFFPLLTSGFLRS